MAIQVVRARERGPSTEDRFFEAFGNASEKIGSALAQRRANQLRSDQEKEENEAIKHFGLDLTGIRNPKTREQILASELQGHKTQKEDQEKLSGLTSALDTVNRMREIGKKGHLGFGLSVQKLFNPKARHEAGEYEQLGKSLIQFASNISPRNQKEFETLAGNIYDPSITDDQREGILSAMERIIRNSMGNRSNETPKDFQQKNSKPPLSAFQR